MISSAKAVSDLDTQAFDAIRAFFLVDLFENFVDAPARVRRSLPADLVIAACTTHVCKFTMGVGTVQADKVLRASSVLPLVVGHPPHFQVQLRNAPDHWRLLTVHDPLSAQRV